ncbi:MAG: hypothetical protein RLZZ499_3407 [Cyanobacteriota bacterium]
MSNLFKTMNTDELYFKLLKHCSGIFLAIEIPDDWNELHEIEQNRFLEGYAIEPLDYYTGEDIWLLIERTATNLDLFLQKLQKEIPEIADLESPDFPSSTTNEEETIINSGLVVATEIV